MKISFDITLQEIEIKLAILGKLNIKEFLNSKAKYGGPEERHYEMFSVALEQKGYARNSGNKHLIHVINFGK